LLGDMLELDEQAAQLHRELVPAILAARSRVVVLVGECMRELVTLLTRHRMAVHWFDTASAAWEEVKRTVLHNEVLMVKGSNSTGLYALVRELEASYSA